MAAKNLMTPSMLAKELNLGSATIRFWLNRFSQWLPYTLENGEKLYHADCLRTLVAIADKIDSGMVPKEIEKVLDALKRPVQGDVFTGQSLSNGVSIVPSMHQELESQDSIKVITSLFEKFYNQQERVAAVEERKVKAEELKAEAEQRRATAEEQKAEALAKRAEAELQKAHAMNNLADALKNISKDFLDTLHTKSVAPSSSPDGATHSMESMPPADSNTSHDKDENFDDLDSLVADEAQNLIANISDSGMDDLSALIADDPSYPASETLDSGMDDLSALIADDPSYPASETLDSGMDDLSALIADDPSYPASETLDSGMDDLFALINDQQQDNLIPNILDSDVDDLLSFTGDDTSDMVPGELFDQKRLGIDTTDALSALIEESITDLNPNNLDSELDDLMSLIDDDKSEMPMDLLDQESLGNSAMTDDISSIIEAEYTPPPKIEKPKESLESNFEKYKAEVLNIIIKLRKDGHDVNETAELLNNEGIATLSGKGRWTTKMIAKIYTFIEAAKK